MSKPRAKLSAEQKQWLENLEWYAKNVAAKVLSDEVTPSFDYTKLVPDFKEVVECGRYAIFSMRPNTWDDHNKEWIPGGRAVLGAPDEHTVDCMIKYNCNELDHVVDLDSLMMVREVRKLARPNFMNWVAKMNKVEVRPL
jgi:hypothetical protein